MLADNRVTETSFSFSTAVPVPGERRQIERHITILRVGIIIIEGRRELCLIRNISAGGLMAHVYSPIEAGQRVTIELKTEQPIDGSVMWTEGADAGIAFDERVDIAGLLAAPPRLDNGWRPRLPRVEIDRLGTLRVGARTYWIQARDISQGGVKIELDQPLEVDADVVVTLEHFRPVAGTVRWQHGRSCGINFNAPVPFDELIAWLKREG